MREDTVKKAAGGGKVYALTAAGRAAAARLHAEAEAAGYCSCGRVAKAKVAPLQGAGAGNPLGLREARLPLTLIPTLALTPTLTLTLTPTLTQL